MPAKAGGESGAVAGSGDSPSEDGDALLLGRVRRGDAAAFRVLVTRHLPAMLGIARRMLRDDAEAEDVAQEALLRLWRMAGDLELGASGVRPWLRRVVSNLCIDRIRATQRLEVRDDVPEGRMPAQQLQKLGERDLAAHVDMALKALPERQRLALTLFHYEGMSQADIGGIMGVSEDAVESLLGRARRSLRAALEGEWRQLLWDEP